MRKGYKREVFWVYDGARWTFRRTLSVAMSDGQDAIDKLRERCDPEWSDSVEDIAIYRAPPDMR